MRLRTSITLSPETVAALDELGGNRSRHVEAAIIAYLDDIRRRRRDEQDRSIIAANCDFMNAEVEDFLELQEAL